MQERDYCSEEKNTDDACIAPCPLERGMRLIGGKWTGSILWHIKDGPTRFNELSRQIPAASRNMLNERLKFMDEKKLVRRIVISDRPLAVMYEITDFGRTALSFLDSIQQWAQEHDL